MKTSSGYSLVEMMVGISLMGSVAVMTTEILQRINKGVSSQEILNQSRNEAMVFFQRVHHASMTVLPDACADDMTARSVVGQADDSAAQMNLSVNLGGDADPEFVLMNSCVEKPAGMKKPPVMSSQYLQNIVRKDAKRRMSNRMNYDEAQCLSQMQVSCPENYMPVTRLVYYGRDGSARQMYFPRASNRRSDGTVTSFACTFKEPGVGGPINVVLFAGHKDPAMQSATEEVVKWTSFRTVLPPRPTNAAYVRSPDVCSAMSPLPLDVTPGTAALPSGGGSSSGETGFEVENSGETLVQVGDAAQPADSTIAGTNSGENTASTREIEEEKNEILEAFESLSDRNKKRVKSYLNIAKFFLAKSERSRINSMKNRHLRTTNFYLSKVEGMLGITPERNMSYNDRLENLKEHTEV